MISVRQLSNSKVAIRMITTRLVSGAACTIFKDKARNEKTSITVYITDNFGIFSPVYLHTYVYMCVYTRVDNYHLRLRKNTVSNI